MTNIRNWTYMSMMALLAVLLTACTADSSDDQRKERTLHLRAVSQRYSDIQVRTTRAFDVTDPNDNTAKVTYDSYTDAASIRAYIATSNRLDFYGDFEYTGSEWTTKIPLDNDYYYIYGFMPSSLRNTSTIAPRNDSYAYGAVLTIGNTPALMTEPVCAIVGVKRAASATDNIAANNMQRGKYDSEGTTDNANNYIFMLLDHLYCGVRFTMAVSSDYYALRRIHLKEFNIKPKAGSVNVTATMAANSFNTLSIGYTKTADYSGTGVNLWEGTKNILLKEHNSVTPDPTLLYGTISPTTGDSFTATPLYVAPVEGNNEFTIRCVYDIYDRTDSYLIRKDCVAENKLSIGGTGWKAGERYTVPLIIMPTYLYVLSDPDLDNPTININ